MDPIYDDEDDRDHPLQEPQFVMHAVDDDRRRRDLLQVQVQQPPPPHDEPDGDQQRANAARIERLRHFMLFPQVIKVFVSRLSFFKIDWST